MAELSQDTKKLIFEYQKWEKSLQPEGGVSTIRVDEVASRVASFYEKIRGIIDWKEEHLLKRGAIERSLKRRILPQINIGNGKFIESRISAESLVLELIRSGHFPNDQIPESGIQRVQGIIDKYIHFLNNSPSFDSKIELYQWLSSIAACEIEESLTPSLKERALMNYMYLSLREKIKLNESFVKKTGVSENEKDTQIYINVQKSLFDLDTPVITYHLIKHKYPEWINPAPAQLEELSKNVHMIKEGVENALDHPISGKIYRICQKYNTPYFILGDVIEEDPQKAEEKISNPERFEAAIREKYNGRLKTVKSRIRRAAFYSTLSIFLTNIFALIVIEIPLTKYLGNFTPVTYAIDIFIPTLLMGFLVITVKLPPKNNLETVVMETFKITYENKKKDVYDIKAFRRRGPVFNALIALIYLIGFAASLGFIVWALSKINFPPFSYFIFITFLSLIAFAGTKIRQKAEDLNMIERKETFINILIDFFALPIIHLGKWLTARWKRYNIISTIFNALIDMPFSIFVEFLEQWRYFLKEKREKL